MRGKAAEPVCYRPLVAQVRGTPSLALLCSLVTATHSLACNGGGERRQLSFEIAAELANGSGACEGSLTEQLSPCTTVEVFRLGEDGSRVPVRSRRLEPEEGSEPTGAFKLRFDSRDIAFDVEELTVEDVVDLEIQVFADDGRPLYGATVEGVHLLAGEPIRVRLYPFRRWACPGGGVPAPRALHAAVPLPGGDVLIFGGVSGRNVDPASVVDRSRTGALLQRAIELYDARSHRFVAVSGDGPDGQPGFGRVLFDALYLGSASGPDDHRVHRVRVTGGFQLRADSGATTALRFDNTGVLGGPLGSPLAPSEDMEVGDAVDLLFDEDARTVTFEAVDEASVPSGALVERSGFLGLGASDDPALVLFGMAREGWAPASEFHLIERSGDRRPARPLVTPRLGATPMVLPREYEGFLIWGGNVEDGGRAESVGELQFVDEGRAARAIPASAGGPIATSFHTITRLGRDDLFLVAGGYQIDGEGVIGGAAPAEPLLAVQVVPGPDIELRRVAAEGYTPSILHTASEIDGLGVLLVGGAHRADGNRLAPQAQVGVVDGRFAFSPLSADEPGRGRLSIARWGHTATALPGHRVLVIGGFGRDPEGDGANALRALERPELLYVRPAPPPLAAGQCGRDVVEPPDASAPKLDGGLPPPIGSDPAVSDAGVPPLTSDGGSTGDAAFGSDLDGG